MPSVQQTKRQHKVRLRDASFDYLKKESSLFSYKPSKKKK
jgi:hypothetical protein